MYSTILLAVALQNWDRYSAYALAARDVAGTLAKGAGNRLQVLSVYEYEIPSVSGLPTDVVAQRRESIMQSTDSHMERRMNDYIAPLKEDGIVVQSLLRVGNPREVIVQVAGSITADLLVIGSHSKRGIFNVPLGGTARQINSRTPCPVVLVSPKT
jgi:nucleotide-binding universal stress UspA family protein